MSKIVDKPTYQPAEAQVTYREDNKVFTKRMGCCYDETKEHWQSTCKNWRSPTEFISAIVSIDAAWLRLYNQNSDDYPDKEIS